MKFSGKDEIFNCRFFNFRVSYEADLAAKGPESRKGLNGKDEDYQKKLENVRTGHRAEWYLIKKHGFTEDHTICHDIISPKGNQIEVKVSAGSPHTENGKKWREQQRKKATKQRNIGRIDANIMYMFGHNRHAEGHPYVFEGTYLYNINTAEFEFETTDMIM